MNIIVVLAAELFMNVIFYLQLFKYFIVNVVVLVSFFTHIFCKTTENGMSFVVVNILLQGKYIIT